MAKSTYLSIITLNVNPLNAPMKAWRVVEWIPCPTPKRPIYIHAAYKKLTSY